jgi:hypothetical protein
MLVMLEADEPLRFKDNEIRERCSRRLSGMKNYLENSLPAIVKAKGQPYLSDTSLWLDTYAIPILSAYTKVNITVFETTKKFIPTDEMTRHGLRWWLALHAGDGVDSCRFHSLFTYRECHDVISKRTRFCTTGVNGRETQASSKNGILCHFYPIATHSSDISDAVIEALESLAKALAENNDIMLIRYGYSNTTRAISQ